VLRKNEKTPAAQKTDEKSAPSNAQMTRVFQSSESSLNWKLPKVEDILNPAVKTIVRQNVDQERAKVIEDTLTSFGAPGRVVEIHRGPTFTQFGVEPDLIQTRNGQMRVRVNKINSLSDDLALAWQPRASASRRPSPAGITSASKCLTRKQSWYPCAKVSRANPSNT
jgi:S-DNA-T family DNA segregation ATPase FtsK/SpoIIIE